MQPLKKLLGALAYPLNFHVRDRETDSDTSSGTFFSAHSNLTTTSNIVDRTMTTSPVPPGPVIPYTMHNLPGPPVRFLIGALKMAYDVHSTLLASESPAFQRIFSAPIILPTILPGHFAILMKWLYSRTPPKFTTTSELLLLCHLWVSACKLGLWQKANTLLRLGMELMAPKTAVCDINTVRWVFSNTPASSPLRGFIIALFCQRSAFDFSSSSPVDKDVFSRANVFMRELERARKKLARGKVGGAWAITEEGLPVFDHILAGGKKEEVKIPLPEYLLWGEEAEPLPDRWFVFPREEAFLEGLAEGLEV